MDALEIGDFRAFFEELHGVLPFPWQERLARRVCETGWPPVLDLPTSSGKTACLDIAVFAMAFRQRGPRRVFFVVDRRIVVDTAYRRMRDIAKKLQAASSGTLKLVAERLGAMSCGEVPLDTYQLRGGIYRDDSWVRSPLQPTLIASTVDQVGSRLLFRGYGVWDKQWPMQAALIANDALILLDEAHCSVPFAETLGSVCQYRTWATEDLKTPFAFVQMTATPAQEANAFSLTAGDTQNPTLHQRLYASKPAHLIKVKGNDLGKLADALVAEAIDLARQPKLRRIAVMVNRVRTARLVYQALRERGECAQLLIGRMRPIDRTGLPPEIVEMLAGNRRTPGAEPVFVVATQCLEVGADLDFDVLITECASIDALLQRFGRLDRLGDLQSSGATAQGRVVISSSAADSKEPDPVYSDALAATWKWLTSLGDLDFGICSESGNVTIRERLQTLAPANANLLRRESPRAPVLLPAHLDLLAQTSPRPSLDPDVSLYLHGEEKGSPDVQVVWRADLDPASSKQWAEIVALCPPVAAEAMAVPIGDFKAWLTGAGPSAASSDIEGIGRSDEETGESVRCPVLRWRGDHSEVIDAESETKPARIRPGDTLVLSGASKGWDDLGHIPENIAPDRAEEARQYLGSRWILRLHSRLIETWPDNGAKTILKSAIEDPAADPSTLWSAFADYVAVLNGQGEWQARLAANRPKKIDAEAYPGSAGWILSSVEIEADAGQDESSVSRSVPLADHLNDVTQAVTEFAEALVEDAATRRSLISAAEVHDCGKADPRFQALLHGGNPFAARVAPKLLAKGAASRQSKQVRRARWRQAGLPDDFRHELISLLLARQDTEISRHDLTLHLIASHHGRCRPFAPFVDDNGAGFAYNGWNITPQQRSAESAHRLDSGVADRFWTLTRRYGWWGLAYLESLLRLGDWKASKEEGEKS
jgi:CRISPR-associated endonuclease/helicase Cas3